MGSGKAKTVPVSPFSFLTIPSKEQYADDLLFNPFFLEREKAMKREAESIKGDYESIVQAHIDSSYNTKLMKKELSDFFADYNDYDGDRALKVLEVFSDSDWRKVYEEIGLHNISEVEGMLDAVDILLEKDFFDLTDDKEKYQFLLRDKFMKINVNDKLQGRTAIRNQDVVDALSNMFEGKSPYTRNPMARGKYQFEVKSSPYTQHLQKLQAQTLIQSFKNADKLKDTFERISPDIKLRVKKFTYQNVSLPSNNGILAFYYPDHDLINVLPLALSSKVVATMGTLSPFRSSYTVSRTPVDIVSHEFGHALHLSLSEHFTDPMNPQTPKTKAFQKKENWDLFYTPTDGEDYSSLPFEAVSLYGNTNKREAFAEAFSMYTMGAVPAKNVGDKYFATFSTFMKEMGLEEYKGINSYNVTHPNNVAPNKQSTVTTKTLTPDSLTNKTNVPLSYSIDGESYTYTKTPNALKQGYFVKTVNKVRYTIDINTGRILRQKGAK